MKRLFSLPTTSPNVAVIYTFGLLYIAQAIDKKRFLYLYRILNRDESKWSLKFLLELQEMNIGWTRNILQKLNEYGLESDFATIKKYTFNEWKEKVRVAVLKRNGQKLLENCVEMNGDVAKVMTKTKHIHDALVNNKYNAEPVKYIIGTDKQRARTFFLSQNGMLECGKNRKGTIPEICIDCQVPDDENHRLNSCKKWTRGNDNGTRCDFRDVYSDNPDTVDGIIGEIEKIWETKYANGRMKKD